MICNVTGLVVFFNTKTTDVKMFESLHDWSLSLKTESRILRVRVSLFTNSNTGWKKLSMWGETAAFAARCFTHPAISVFACLQLRSLWVNVCFFHVHPLHICVPLLRPLTSRPPLFSPFSLMMVHVRRAPASFVSHLHHLIFITVIRRSAERVGPHWACISPPLESQSALFT